VSTRSGKNDRREQHDRLPGCILAFLWLAIAAGCVPPKVVRYTSFHDREFSARSQPATIQEKSSAELLGSGYLLIGYLDLRRNVRTCYETGGCVDYADTLPSRDELLTEAARRGGDVVTLLEERTVIEANDKTICTNMSTSVKMVNDVPQVTATCTTHQRIPGKLEAKISRALIWRQDPDAARSDANARAIELAMKELEATYASEKVTATRSQDAGLASTFGKSAGKDDTTARGLDAFDRQVYSAIDANDSQLLYTLARDGKLQTWKDDKDRSALMVAISAGQPEAARTLLAIDRGLERRDNAGRSAMHYAARSADLSLVQELHKAGYDLRHKSDGSMSPLFYALLNPRTEVFEWILDQGADIKELTALGETTLMAAAIVGHEPLIRRLLDLGLDINQQDTNGRTALMYAVRYDRLRAVQLLLKERARLDSIDKDGHTVLHHAVSGGGREVLAALLERGVDINAESNTGRTALIVAIAGDKWDAAHFLIDRGARMTTNKITAEHVAVRLIDSNQPQLLKRYLDAFPPVKELALRDPDWLQHAAKSSGSETIKFLVGLGARVDRRGTDGRTPLMTACSAGNPATARALLELKADPGLRDTRNQTALKIATLNGHAKVVETLREFQVRE
jgi:uncharacterized protein